ncbi:hypothetical protein GCM10011320_50000 [Neoroseomonas lacus]|uniref:Uncharacterized protein n=1 Tax=Neoroseomonas lacus TaxID=287609 RepID=A0A917L086_9PROT|nr:hypothetical protein GCM10011320_50000 [Neoroseomonas lacus]
MARGTAIKRPSHRLNATIARPGIGALSRFAGMPTRTRRNAPER